MDTILHRSEIKVPNQSIAEASSGLTYTATGGTVVAGTLGTNEMVAIAGLALGALTFAVNIYYRHRMFVLAKAAANSRGMAVGKRISDEQQWGKQFCDRVQSDEACINCPVGTACDLYRGPGE